MRTVGAWTVALLAAIGAAVGVMSAVWQAPLPTSLFIGTSPTPPVPGLTDRIVLSTTTVVAGQSFMATLILTNHTDWPIRLTVGRVLKCDPQFGIDLRNSTYVPDDAWAQPCVGPRYGPPGLPIYPGQRRIQIEVSTTYNGCSDAWESAVSYPLQTPPTVPTCLKGGLPPPIPAGVYMAVLVGGSIGVPAAWAGPVNVVGG